MLPFGRLLLGHCRGAGVRARLGWALEAAANDAGGLEARGRWWQVRDPTGTGGALPCSRNGR